MHDAVNGRASIGQHAASRVRWAVRGAAALLLALAPVAARAQRPGTDPLLGGLPAAMLPPALRAALLEAAPELAARRAAVVASQARLGATGFAPAAVLSFESEESPNGRLASGNTRVDIGRDFLTGARRRAAREVVATDVRLAQIGFESAERRVLARGARAFAQVVGWRIVASRLAAQDSLLASAEEALRTRFAVGDARYVDVLRLRTERLRVQAERAVAVTEARTGVAALDALLAGATSSAAVLPALLASTVSGESLARGFAALPPAPPLDSLLAVAADVRQAAAQVERSAASRRLLLANQRPLLSAALGVQRVGGDGSGASVGPVFGASVSLPFTARRANQAAAGAALQEVAATEAARVATSAAVRGALAAARERYEAARERLAGYDAALLRAARDERESALAAYRTGELSLLEFVDFERALTRAEIDRTRAGLDALTALADLLSGAPASDSPTLMTDLVPLEGSGRGTND
ncbi:MAG: TolC family protein [Gemmatimonadaceae bacterium]|nr:TolC family protein [Gemmatimonadaceae bacterium]